LKLAGNADCLSGFSAGQLHSPMMLFINTDSDIALIGLVFFGFGMAVHGYSFFQSKFVPRLLSGFYISASLLLLIGAFVLLIFKGSSGLINPSFIVPDFVAELSLALWLTFKGIKIHSNLQ
jgi:hypothetical protein